MRRLTAPERAFISGDKIGKDWFSLKETIPEQYKEDFDDNLLFELVRPWPFQLENENQFRDVFRGQGGTMDYRFLQESLENYVFFEKILKFENVTGRSNKADAKIAGITPAEFILSGK